MVYEFQLLVADSIMMLVKFRTSANQKHWIWSRDESELCNPRLLGDESQMKLQFNVEENGCMNCYW